MRSMPQPLEAPKTSGTSKDSDVRELAPAPKKVLDLIELKQRREDMVKRAARKLKLIDEEIDALKGRVSEQWREQVMDRLKKQIDELNALLESGPSRGGDNEWKAFQADGRATLQDYHERLAQLSGEGWEDTQKLATMKLKGLEMERSELLEKVPREVRSKKEQEERREERERLAELEELRTLVTKLRKKTLDELRQAAPTGFWIFSRRVPEKIYTHAFLPKGLEKEFNRYRTLVARIFPSVSHDFGDRMIEIKKARTSGMKDRDVFPKLLDAYQSYLSLDELSGRIRSLKTLLGTKKGTLTKPRIIPFPRTRVKGKPGQFPKPGEHGLDEPAAAE